MKTLTYLFLARFPLLLALTLVGYGFIADLLFPQFFESTLIVDLPGMGQVAFLMTLASLTVMLTLHVVLRYGGTRFDVPSPVASKTLTVRDTLLYCGLALPLLYFVAINSRRPNVPLAWFIVWAGAGIFVALLMFWALIALQQLLSSPGHQGQDPLLPTAWLRTTLRRDYIPAGVRERLNGLSGYIASHLGPGYVGIDGRLLPYHGLGLALLGLYATWYAVQYWRGMPGTEAGASTPGLTYLLVLATGLAWLFSGLAFLLDRYRVPVLILVVVWSALVSFYSRSDHYFVHVPTADIRFASPTEIADRAAAAPLVIATIDGGGIQAAGWTAVALTGIQRAWPDFHRSLKLISSVSGGSLGAMYYIGALKHDRPLDTRALDRVVALASRGAVSELGWGIAYPDFWRLIVPLPPPWRLAKDRAWAIEKAWARDWPGASDRISDWAQSAASGEIPSIAFNTTSVEQGHRFLITSFAVPEEWAVEHFNRKYASREVDVVTATRLSAAFFYTTPAARAWPDTPDRSAQHIVDGGYYDNSGMLTGLQWLNEVLRSSPEKYRDKPVGVIRVASFPDYQGTNVADRSTWYQFVAPFITAFASYRAGQIDRLRSEFEHFKNYWCTRGIEVTLFEFQFDGDDPPFTWSFTPAQIEQLGVKWTSSVNQVRLRELVETMHGGYATRPDPCPVAPVTSASN